MKNEFKYKHFVITRFNIKIEYGCSLKNPDNNPMKKILDEDYLEDRFSIFEKYTLLSMKQQTNQNFTWLVLFHKKTPEIFKRKIEELKKLYHFVDLYFDDGEKFDFAEYCGGEEKDIEYFITTKIDNDDMFANDYIAKIQEYVNNNFHECVLSFAKGLKYDLDSKKQYEYERNDNHFLSMLGKKEKNILLYNHAKIFDSGEEVVLLDSDKPMWVEIIHESNVTNRINDENNELEKRLYLDIE